MSFMDKTYYQRMHTDESESEESSDMSEERDQTPSESPAASPLAGLVSRDRKTFDLIDEDESGYVSLDELRAFLQHLDASISEQQVRDTFDDLDEDKNGLVSKKEFLKKDWNGILRSRETFEEIDADQSGYISLDELHAFMKVIDPAVTDKEVQQMFNDMDLNGSGLVTRREFRRRSHPHAPDTLWNGQRGHILRTKDTFEEIDADQSGYITLDELRDFIKASDPSATDEQVTRVFKDLDRNGNKLVSKSEFLRRSHAHAPAFHGILRRSKGTFLEIDADQSGYISLDELLSFVKANDPSVTDEQVKNIFNDMDRNGNGWVSKSEFLHRHSHHHQSSLLAALVLDPKTFEEIDVDRSGYLSLDELRAFLHTQDPSISEQQVRDTFNDMDRSKNGLVSRREFLRRHYQHSQHNDDRRSSPLAPLTTYVGPDSTRSIKKTQSSDRIQSLLRSTSTNYQLDNDLVGETEWVREMGHDVRKETSHHLPQQSSHELTSSPSRALKKNIDDFLSESTGGGADRCEGERGGEHERGAGEKGNGSEEELSPHVSTDASADLCADASEDAEAHLLAILEQANKKRKALARRASVLGLTRTVSAEYAGLTRTVSAVGSVSSVYSCTSSMSAASSYSYIFRKRQKVPFSKVTHLLDCQK
jgi:Ca2+-binding EF-hand superfamily protein